jgi:Cu/Ag efflux protein CusF
MHSIRRIGLAAIPAAVVVGLAALAVPSMAQQHAEHGKPGETAPGAQAPAGPAARETPAVTAAEVVTAAATVDSIDKKEGKATLKDTQGHTFEIKAGPQVNLDRLHVGDKVMATYYAEVAVAIGRAGQGNPRVTETSVTRGGVTARQATVTAHIVSVDPKKNTVDVRGPGDNTHTLKVEDPSLQAQLKQIKPGDQLEVTYMQAVALSVEPQKSAEPPKAPEPQKAPPKP